MKPNLTGALLMTAVTAAVFSAADSGLFAQSAEPADAHATIRCTFQPYAKPEILTDHLNLGGTNPSGGSIGINSLYLIRDGKPWIPVMGELHFSRVPREQWPAELAKLKAGGVTVVSFDYYDGREEFIDNEKMARFLAARLSAVDYRSEDERRAWPAKRRALKYAQYNATGRWSYFVNRAHFRLYRHFRKWVEKKGLDRLG